MHPRVSTLVALAAALALPSVSADYRATCPSAFMSNDGHTLQATCWANNKDLVNAQIDLNKCVANYNGNLACAKNGGFAGSCNTGTCDLPDAGRTFRCKCGGPQGDHYTQMDLGSCLVNDHGKLRC